MLRAEVRTLEDKFELNGDKYELALVVYFVTENPAPIAGLDIKAMSVEWDIKRC